MFYTLRLVYFLLFCLTIYFYHYTHKKSTHSQVLFIFHFLVVAKKPLPLWYLNWFLHHMSRSPEPHFHLPFQSIVHHFPILYNIFVSTTSNFVSLFTQILPCPLQPPTPKIKLYIFFSIEIYCQIAYINSSYIKG